MKCFYRVVWEIFLSGLDRLGPRERRRMTSGTRNGDGKENITPKEDMRVRRQFVRQTTAINIPNHAPKKEGGMEKFEK